MWKGSTENAFTITIPAGVKVLKITTENTYVNEFVDPNLPRYIGVTGGKTYNMRWAIVEEGDIPEPEYWDVQVYRYNSSSDFKQWVSSDAGDAIEGATTTNIQIIAVVVETRIPPALAVGSVNRLTTGEKIIVDNPSKLLQNKINEIFKGDNMENSNQIEAPVKFGILEEEKVSRKFYPVKNAPADTVLPKRKTAKSAGYDFVLPCDVRLNPRSVSAIIQTNVKAFMPDDEVLMLYIRSSIGIKQHVTLANGTGIIDADYFSNPDNDGNIGICLQNNSDEIVSFKKGERIMQGIFVKYAVCDSDDTNEVRKGGFGSTGKE